MEDVKKDLSNTDAAQLRAFLEKRRWFENKLKVLDSVDPVYPFLHPVLILGEDGSWTRDGVSNAEWTLPSVEEVRAWQNDRDALEEEVLAFDGGDLGRMKAKTREVTLIPLTPPSTELVSITLDLIVVVDRLLGLLRRRSDVLELVSLRIQWDTARASLQQELNSFRQEVQALATGTRRWHPPRKGAKVATNRTSLASTNVLTAVDSSTPRPSTMSTRDDCVVMLTKTNAPPLLSQSADVGMKSHHLKNRHRPRQSLELPLLNSQISNLRIRIKNISSTQLPRTGALLDRMIDIAGPMKGLGGTKGPESDTKPDGAVPEDFLDLQDDLDLAVTDVQGLVDWCHELEVQWDEADTHYSASSNAENAAEDLIESVRISLAKPVTTDQHQLVLSKLTSIRNGLPAPPGRSFPKPTHNDIPECESQNQRIVNDLSDQHRKAADSLKQCEEVVAWHAQLYESSDTVTSLMQKALALFGKFGETQDDLTVSKGRRPDFAGASQLGTFDEWLRIGPEIINRVEVDLQSSGMLVTNTEEALAKHRKILYLSPATLRDGFADHKIPDTVGEQAEQQVMSIRRLEVDINRLIPSVKQELEIARYACCILRNGPQCRCELEDAIQRLQVAIRGQAWKVEVRKTPTIDKSCFDELQERIMKEISEPHSALIRVLQGSTGSEMPLATEAQITAKEIQATAIRLEGMKQFLDVVYRQTNTTNDIMAESENFIKVFSKILEGLKTLDQSATVLQVAPETMETLNQLDSAVQTWQSELDKRVIIIPKVNFSQIFSPVVRIPSTDPSSSGTSLQNPRMSQSDPPLTPPMTPPPAHPDLQAITSPSISTGEKGISEEFLDSLNASVRRQINEQSARVSGGLRQCQDMVRELPYMRWMKRTESLVKELESSMTSADTLCGTLRARAARTGDVPHDSLDALRHQSSKALGKLDEVIGAITQWTSTETLQKLGQIDDLPQTKVMVGKIVESAEKVKLDLQATLRDLELAANQMTIGLQPLADKSTGADTSEDQDDVFGSRTPQVVASSSNKSIRRNKSSLPPNEGPANHTDEDRLSTTRPGSAQFTTPVPAPSPRITSRPFPQTTSIPVHINRTPGHVTSRSASNPTTIMTGGNYRHSTESSRNRTVSESIRTRVDSMSSISGYPSRSGRESPFGLPMTSGAGTPSRIPRAIRPSTPGSHSRNPSTSSVAESRISSSSGGPKHVLRRPTPKPRVSYHADPKNQLDVEVGKIVNKLRVNVPIVPVGLDSDEEWKDQTGRYWIGAEGRAKLCFCRILRSKTVMVRVGGGWMELSKFLIDHFADAVWTAPLDDAPALPTIQSIPQDLAAEASSPITQVASVNDIPLATPIRPRPKPLLPSNSKAITPSHLSPADTPIHASSPSYRSPSGSSPLVPLHFMRKASESPPVREKEKELLQLGKRSILGRENVGMDVSPTKTGIQESH